MALAEPAPLLSEQKAESDSEAAGRRAPSETGSWRMQPKPANALLLLPVKLPPPPSGGRFAVTSCHRPPWTPQQVGMTLCTL